MHNYVEYNIGLEAKVTGQAAVLRKQYLLPGLCFYVEG